MYGIVYKTTNLINGKTYIGQTTRSKAYYYGSGTLIIKAIKKYGKNNFEKEILCERETQDSLDHAERLYIALLKPEYNIDLGGKNKGKCSEAHKEKIRKINKGKKRSEETKKKMREYHYKYPKKGKDSPLYGKPQRLESRLKRSRSMKGRRLGGDSNGAVKIRCVETQEIFSTIRLASIKYNIPESNISLASAGKRKSAGKLHWERYYG